MSEPIPEPPTPATTHEPPAPERELARKNILWGLSLLGLVLLIAAGTVAVALVYLAFD